MNDIIGMAYDLNKMIADSPQYTEYTRAWKALKAEPELYEKLKYFRRQNYELQNGYIDNPFDEILNLTRENDEMLHHSIVSDFLNAEGKITRLMQEIYNQISEGLEFDYPDEY